MAFATTYELRGAVAATFPSTHTAHAAAHALQRAGYDDTWTGFVTRVADVSGAASGPRGRDVVVEAENWFQRLFGEGRKTLHDVLIESGMSANFGPERERLHEHSVVLTVDGIELDEATRIIERHGGAMLHSGYENMLEPPHFAVATPNGAVHVEAAFPDAYGFVRRRRPRHEDSDPGVHSRSEPPLPGHS